MGNGCYGDNFPISLHWNKVTSGDRGVSLSVLTDRIRKLPGFFPLRYGVLGDIPQQELHWQQICESIGSRKLKAWCYTHRPYDERTHKVAALNGLTINYSCHSEAEAIAHVKAGRYAAIVLRSDCMGPGWPLRDHDGNLTGVTVKLCPQSYDKNITCGSCMLCHDRPANVVIGFPAHGTRKKAAEGTVR
jgi:hypothetical protein